ncbi:hypothetical protein BESB_023770 [Besnoitia besnoiti]|uniref:Uncharacterized protein n=1 Tax=Besnoitia besnoiti TaxID=94643 RepID=A0A2A9M1M0_BESBE|nr:hypothetical protein BESB_023770 [Besnoitia besnoiti]PFH31885.1 hypothetical protein BESB_023770 [Besnoitia besnoiti]
MSYGWLTESSLLPKRAVPIGGVSESSLYTLSSHIFSLQQEQQQKTLEPLVGLQRVSQLAPLGRKRKHPDSAPAVKGSSERRDGAHARTELWERQSEGTESQIRAGGVWGSLDALDADGERGGSGGYTGCEDVNYGLAQRRWGRPSKKPLDRQARLMEGKNPRVEERAAADEQFLAAHAKTVEASRRKLEEKARLYDDVVDRRAENDRRATEEQNQFLCALSKETERRREEIQETKKHRLAMLRSRLLVLRQAAAAAAAAEASDAAADALLKAARAEAVLNEELYGAANAAVELGDVSH